MSKQIEERVVSMQFDNSRFERNVSQSMSTLDKLKQKLNLSGASKGLENVQTAAKKVDMTGISNGVETIRAKFSALEVMGVTALANITNSAVNAGKRMAAALTIEPIKAGFQEYETQMNAVQTILANTQKEGTDVKTVNKALDDLNTYADKTIYNFTEMTRNIGTFTAAGVKLDTSVSAIKGIANLAAVSGSTSQQASTAMYQLSQAIASGTVKLMDWNSVVNAGMGGQVFQDALIRTSEHLKTGANAAIKAKGSFRESLSTGWLTTEVLAQTLDQFSTAADTQEEYEAAVKKFVSQGYSKEQAKQMADMAKTAGEAATKVKTFTQLIDTLKEALGSGWTASWRLIIGDFEEAKKLWTEVSDYFSDAINKSSEARNKMLEGWAEGGGRTKMIESFKNAFNGLLNIIKPIKEAFREIFPPTTAKQLLKITERIHDLTVKFRELTEKNAPKLKSTFKGVFSVIKIGVTVIKAIIGGITQLIGKITGFSGGILSATGSLGDWISGVAKSVTETNIFAKVINKIVDVLGKVIDKFKEFGSFIKSKFEAPGFETFLNILNAIWSGIKKVGLAVVKVASSIGKALGTAFQNGNLKSLLDLVNGGIITAILLKLKSWISGFKDLAGEGKSFVQSIKDVLGTVGDSLTAWQKNIKAETLKKIAISIGILAASLWVLSGIDPEKLGSALGAITVLFVELIGAMKAFEKLDVSAKGVGKASVLMIGMSVAVLILASAVKKLSGLDFEGLAKGVAGVGALLAELVGAAKLMSMGGKDISKGAMQMVLMAAALKIMASVCKDLSALSWEGLAKGVTGIGGLLAVFAGFAELIKLIKPEKLMSSALSLILIGAAMEIFANVCAKFGNMKWEELGKAGAAISGILLIAAGFGKLSSYASKMVRSSIALILIGAAMEIFADVCNKFAQMKWKELGKAGAAIAGILALAAGFALLAGLSSKMLASVVSLTIMAAAMEIFANVCNKFGQMKWEELGKAGAAIAGILVLAAGFALLAGLAPGMIASAASLLIMAAALAVLTPVLTTLGSMSWGEIVKGLVTIAAAFTIFGLAGALLGPVVPAILGLSAAIALFGLGCLAAGVGIAAFAAGLIILSTLTAASATAIVAALHIIIVGILELIPAMIGALTDAVVALCQVFIQSIPAICEAVKVLIIELVNTLLECLPVIIGGIVKLIDMLVEYAPQLVNGLVNLIVALLNALAPRIPDLIGSLVNFLIALFNGVSSNIGPLIEAWFGIFAAIFQGIANAIGPIVQEVIAPILQVLANLIVGLVEAIAPYIPIICAAVTKITEVICSAIVKIIQVLAPFIPAVTKMVEVVANAFARIVEAIAPYIPNITAMIQTIIDAIVSIVQQIVPIINSITCLLQQLSDSIMQILMGIAIVIQTCGNVIAQAFQGIADIITSVGDAIRNSLEGVASVFDSVFGGISDVVTSFGEAIRKVLDGIAGIIDSIGNAALNAGAGFEKLANGVKTITKLNLIDMAASMAAVAKAIGKISSHSEALAASGKGMQQIANGTKLSAQAFTTMSTGITIVTTKLSTIGPLANNAMSALKSAISDTASCFASMSTAAASASASVVASIASMSTVCSSAARSMAMSFSVVGTTLMANLASGIRSGGSVIIATMSSTLRTLVTMARSKAGQFLSIGNTLSTRFVSGVKSKVSAAKRAGASLVSGAASAIKSNEQYKQFVGAGKYLGAGLVAGIQAKETAVYQAAYKLGQKAVQGEKDGQESASPSKATIKAGKWLGEGLAIGIQRIGKTVYNSAYGLGETATGTISKAVASISDIVNSDIDAQPTIRPVLDLSAIRAGAGSMNALFSGRTLSVDMAGVGSVSASMAKFQNGSDSKEIVSSIKALRKDIADMPRNTYNVNGVTYDDGTNVSDAVGSLVRAIKIERRT